LLLAYVAALIPALLMAITQPVWSRVDEAQHADFIIQLSHGIYPAADTTVIDQETLRLMVSTNVFRFDTPGSYPAPDLTDIGPPPRGMSARANAVWMSRHMWQISYESQQTPGYYIAMVPFWFAADKLGGTLVAVYVMRIINAVLIALLAPMAVVVANRLSPGRVEVALLAGLFAILPGLALNGTRVSNDALAAVLGGLAIVLAVKWVGQPWTWRRSGLLGLTLGAGLLVKLTLVGLLPALALAMIWPAPGSSWSRRVGLAAVMAVAALMCLLPWFLTNAHVYGAFVPSARTNQLTGMLPMKFQLPFIGFDIAFFVVTYWTGEPLGALPMAAPFVALGCLLSLLAFAGLIKLLRPLAVPAGPLVVSGAAVCGMAALALLLPATNGFKFAAPGRYGYVALSAAAALFGLGLYSAVPRAFARRTLSGLYGVLVFGLLAAGAAWTTPDPAAGPGTPPSDARLLDATGHGELQGVMITVDRIALDPARRATWFNVTITNSGLSEAEWPVTPIVSVGAVTAQGDYLRSTRMPGDIAAGRSATGWVLVPLDPASLRSGVPVKLRFADVAVNGYSSVEDVVVVLSRA
jgi:hypothetical protein